MNTCIGVDPLELKRFIPFQGLDDHQLLLLAGKMEKRPLQRGHCLFASGDIDTDEFFLVSGELELESMDGRRRTIDAENELARRQIARLRPRQYTATSTRPAEVLVVDADILEALQEEFVSTESDDDAYGVDELGSLEEFENFDLLADFRAALRHNKLVLPSLPEVALKVRKLLEDENTDAATIAQVVNTDAAIAAKLVRAANSALYRGIAKCDTTRNAIVRLGGNNTKQLVVSFTLRDLFRTKSPTLKKTMQDAWQHSVEVAAISFILGRRVHGLPYPAEELLLAGLLHNIGAIALLAYFDSRPDLLNDEERLASIFKQLCGQAGAEILKHWNFPEEFVDMAREVELWQRDNTRSADLCDIVQVAKLHSLIRHHLPLPVPRIVDVPAFHKLPLGELTPEFAIQILDEAKDQINEIKQLLLG